MEDNIQVNENQLSEERDILRDSAVLANAELKIIAALLNDSSATADSVFSKLDVKDFSVKQYQIIFKIMLSLYRDAKTIDYLVVADVIVGEPAYKFLFQDAVSFLLEISNKHTSVVNIVYYIEIVKNASIVRLLNSFGEKLHTYQFNLLNFDSQLIDLQRDFNDIVDSKTSKDIHKLSDVTDTFKTKFINCMKGNNVSGISSGYRLIDNLTGGWQCGDLVIVAARPGKGKTAFALNLALNAALQCREDEYVVVFSLEMGADQIIQRLLSIDSGVSFTLNNSRFLNQTQRELVLDSITNLKTLRIYIGDKNDLNVIEIHNQLKKLVSSGKKIKLVIVDYLQLIKPIHMFKVSNRQEEVSFISRTLKLIARSINVPLISCAQLSRKIEERRGKDAVPQLSDLRESGAIEQDADIVSFLYSESNPSEENETDGIDRDEIDCTWNLAKNRNGPTGKVLFKFLRSISKFSLPIV